MAKQNQAETLDTWGLMTTALDANDAQFVHLATQRNQLRGFLGQAHDLNHQQATLTAAKQEASLQLETIFEEGRKLATFLRLGIKQVYGNRSERLLEFGIRPFRGRPRPPVNPPPPVGEDIKVPAE